MAGTTIETSVPQNPDVPDLPDDGAEELNGAVVADDPAIEARAREMGWKPLAEYRGPPGKWQPAAQFIERGENILPIVRDQNRRLTERLGKLETEFGALRATASEQLQIIKDLREMGRTADQRGYNRALADIEAKKRVAVESGDTKAYDQLVEQAEALSSQRPTTVAAEPARPPTEPTRPAAPQLTVPVQTFLAANPWMSTNKLLGDTMIAFHQEILNERGATQDILNANPELDRELLEEAKSRVMEKYPERFGTPAPTREPAPPQSRQRRAASVAAPTPEPPAPRPGATAATINSIQDPAERAEAREAFNRIKRNMPDYTEAEYMALYSDPHGDVLEMEQKRRTKPNGR
jgi:hypothetical protein